jgi:hypothetical protein
MRADPDVFGLQLVLLLGHNGGCDCEFTEAQLRRGWQVYRRELTDHAGRPGGRPGTRPWAWWVFDRGFEDEPEPSASVRIWPSMGCLCSGSARRWPAASNRLPRLCTRGRWRDTEMVMARWRHAVRWVWSTVPSGPCHGLKEHGEGSSRR